MNRCGQILNSQPTWVLIVPMWQAIFEVLFVHWWACIVRLLACGLFLPSTRKFWSNRFEPREELTRAHEDHKKLSHYKYQYKDTSLSKNGVELVLFIKCTTDYNLHINVIKLFIYVNCMTKPFINGFDISTSCR